MEVTVVGKDVSNKYGALVDSGCDYVLMSRHVADEAMVDLYQGLDHELKIGGALRKLLMVNATIRLCDPSIDNDDERCLVDNMVEWETEVGVFIDWLDPDFQVVLGQVGFFSHFTVTMNHYSRAIVIEELDQLDVNHGPILAPSVSYDPLGRDVRNGRVFLGSDN